jgi:(p)ppGpp synthase/HD superfamily hydrolase
LVVTELTGRFDEALVYASQVHAGQKRNRTEIPYIAHPLAVASLVMEANGSENEIIAALLHDAAEDAGGISRLNDIRAHFGGTVAEIVEACTDSLEEPRPPWRLRKERYLERLAGASDSVILVSLADKLHNARTVLMDYRDLGEAVWQRFQGGRDYASWYFVEAARIFRARGKGKLQAEFDRVINEILSLIKDAR